MDKNIIDKKELLEFLKGKRDEYAQKAFDYQELMGRFTEAESIEFNIPKKKKQKKEKVKKEKEHKETEKEVEEKRLINRTKEILGEIKTEQKKNANE